MSKNLSDLIKEPKIEISSSPGYSNVPGILYEGSIIPLPRNMLGNASYLMGINLVEKPNVNIVERFNTLSALLNNIMEAISYNITHQVPEHTSEIEKSTEEVKRQLDEYMANNVEILEQNRTNIRLDLKDRDKGIENKIDLLFSNQQRIIHQMNELKELILSQDKKYEETRNSILDKIEKIEKSSQTKELKDFKEEILKHQKDLKDYLKMQFEG